MNRRWQRQRAVAAEVAGQAGLFRRCKRAVQRAIVLAYLGILLRSTGAQLTAKAQVRYPRLDRYVFSRRLSELERDGLARKTGERSCEITHRSCITWTLTGVASR
jgi:hypothetical protein